MSIGREGGRRERRAEELRARKEQKRERRELLRAGPPLELLTAARTAEAESASVDVNASESALAWMSGVVVRDGAASGSGTHVLAIGAAALAAVNLVAAGARVVAIDENPARLARAASTLGSTPIPRGHPSVAGPGGYAIGYDALPDTNDAAALFIEADAVAERDLAASLVRLGPFDAVLATVDAPHAARLRHRDLGALGVRDANRYRGELLARVYAIADAVLYSHGALHVVHALARLAPAPAGAQTPAIPESVVREVMRVHATLEARTALRFERIDTWPPLVSVRTRKTA